MANRRPDKKDVDAEIDLHGLTAEQMLLALQKRWSEWRGMRRVRLIHGRGEVLKPELERWCRERGIPFAPDHRNPGALCISPRDRALPDAPLATSLREKGLRLTPEQEAELRDPQAAERARQEAKQRREEEERRRRAEQAGRASQRQREEALWQEEMARLDDLDRRRSRTVRSDEKPAAPRILPTSEIRHQEGYWRGELARVADTDTETLKKEKRTGLDKLAPPIEPKPTPAPEKPSRPQAPQRDTAADRTLFEEEMARLDGADTGSLRRAKRE